VKDLACDREGGFMRWPDPSASPQDDKRRPREYFSECV
jgi:hypothetical protein